MAYSSSSAMSEMSASPRRRYKYVPNQSISPLLLCPICEDPFIDPVTAANGRRGCRACFGSTDGPFVDIKEWIVVEMLNALLVQCEACDQTNIRRDALEKHEQTVCKRAPVSCKAADIKCDWRGERQQLDAHMETCIFEPLRPALAELITENQQLREWIDRLERLVDQLKEQQ